MLIKHKTDMKTRDYNFSTQKEAKSSKSFSDTSEFKVRPRYRRPYLKGRKKKKR